MRKKRRAPRPRGERRKSKKERNQREQRKQRSELTATVDKSGKGFAFLIFQSSDFEDLFVPPKKAAGLFHGDEVSVKIDSDGRVQNITTIKHRFTEVVGQFSIESVRKTTNTGWLTYKRKKAREEIFIPKADAHIKEGEWVRAKLDFHSKGPYPFTGEIVKIYGENVPASADIEIIAGEFGLIEKHTSKAVEEAKSFTEPTLKEFPNRKDLTKLPLMTIDGEDARDFDDAVYVEKKGGDYELWVAIADVSHYVREESALDGEAFQRSTSVYFPERAFHMLPRELSEEICSLKPNVPRLSLVAKIRFSPDGIPKRTEIFEAVIKSKRRATYTEIENEKKDHPVLFELYRKLREQRTKRGSIDFDLPEVGIQVDKNGEPTQIKTRVRKDSHRLIEEFMIAANEAVTRWMVEQKWPFIFRIHEEPSAEALKKFEKLAQTAGVQIIFRQGKVPPKMLADMVKEFDEHPASILLNTALLRSMKQAVYSTVHTIHYGLASEAYTHFTSPIRRYPDLAVHRLLKMALDYQKRKKRPHDNERKKLEKYLENVSQHSSTRERVAVDAEREIHKIKQARFMKNYLGEEFDGVIVGMIERGIFVQLKDPFVEGLVSKENMKDDFYSFNEDRMAFVGRRTKKTLKIGQEVRVQAVNSDLELRQIDFALVEGGERR